MKYFILIVSYCIVYGNALAQNNGRALLKQKAENDLKEIVQSSPSLSGFMAIDLTSGETISINSDIQFTQASAIKIPILMEVYKQAYENKFALTDIKTLIATNIVGGAGVLNAMPDPVNLSIRNLAVLMICLSDNSATNTLIDLVGMENINKSMKNLGFENTVVQRKMIDQQASLRNQENLSTPAEAARIIKLLHDGKFINKQISEEILSILKKNPLENSEIAKGLPSGISMAFKPGGLGGVSTEWAIVYLSNKPYAIAVMENYKLATNSLNSIPLISKRVYEYFSMMKATDYGVIFD